MLVLLLVLLLTVVTAATVVVSVAFPSRGLWRLADRLGLDPDPDEAADGGALLSLQRQLAQGTSGASHRRSAHR